MPSVGGTDRGTVKPDTVMMAKIVQGSDFKGVVNYILDKNKSAKIIASDGLFVEDKATIVLSFEAQAQMNPKVTKSVGHIALSFSKKRRSPIDRPCDGRNRIGIHGEDGHYRYPVLHSPSLR